MKDQFDLVVVGGGIHGLIIATFASERGLRTLLVEKGRVGAATTAGWFGILHGGLRYLQSLDVLRFRKSLADSRWFLQNFKDHVVRQPFLMPLYGRGLKRPNVFRAAMLIERTLGPDRNREVPEHGRLSRGRVLSPEEVARIFPAVSTEGLQGGALWDELVVPNGEGLIEALLTRARAAGLTVRDETEATGLCAPNGWVEGIETTAGTFDAAAVVNAGGAWSPDLARRFDPGARFFAGACLAFNLLIDRPLPATAGLSLTRLDGAGGMVFLYPTPSGQTFAGTCYLPFTGNPNHDAVSEEAASAFLLDISKAMPGLEAREDDIVEITSGLLPAVASGAVDLLDRDLIHEHGRTGGPAGLVSLWGTKYTTAPSAARLVLKRLGV